MRRAPPGRGVRRRRSPTYEDKLIAALRGPLPDRRLLAAQILGRIRSRKAIGALKAVARDPSDPYLAAAAAQALARIDPDLPVVTELARAGPNLARRAILSVRGGCGFGHRPKGGHGTSRSWRVDRDERRDPK